MARRATCDPPPSSGVATRWLLGIAAALAIGAVGGLVAYGGQRADVLIVKQRQALTESIQLRDGRQLAETTARVRTIEAWLTRIEGKLDRALRDGAK